MKLFCNIASKRFKNQGCAFYHPHSNLFCNKSSCCIFRRVGRESTEWLYFFETTSVRVACFTGPRQTCFVARAVRVWRDSNVILSSEKSVFTLSSNLICGKAGLNVGGKTCNIAFNHVPQQC